ncbi:AcrR family transcriptional regulator [Catenulispora sp. GP43]|uniref:TetR/AcrR family transcriptional regulator n=1 Tax=Catenulispora sp. GP43 TaxID=3156263 RepID=UPI003518115D
MEAGTVDWSSFGTRADGAAAPEAEGLRERKKRLLRQQLSDTATEMFLAEGFDAVRVSAIAAACGVSEKTVFNYFPTKESLILDRFETLPEEVAAALSTPGTPLVEAVLGVLNRELRALTGWMAAQPDYGEAVRQIARFGALLGSTPSLRAHQREAADRLTAEAARVLSALAGPAGHAVEAQVAAHALVGLWPAQYAALRRHLMSARSGEELFGLVSAEVRRAARVVDQGLGSWMPVTRPGAHGPSLSP